MIATDVLVDTPLVARLRVLANDYDETAALVPADASIRRAAQQLRLVRLLVVEGIYTPTEGYAWLKAGRAILAQIHASWEPRP